MSLHRIFDEIEDLLESDDIATLDDYLARADLKPLSPAEMIGLVRASYRARRVLPSWQGTVYRVRDELVARGEPFPEKLLVNLL